MDMYYLTYKIYIIPDYKIINYDNDAFTTT